MIYLLIFAGIVNLADGNVCSSPEGSDIRLRLKRFYPSPFAYNSYKQLMKNISAEISEYTELRDVLQRQSDGFNDFDVILADDRLHDLLNLTKTLVTDNSDMESLEIKHHVQFKIELEYDQVDPAYFYDENPQKNNISQYFHTQTFAYKVHWSQNIMANLMAYKLKLTSSSPVDIFIIATVHADTLMTHRKALVEFDYSTLTEGIPDVLWLPHIDVSDLITNTLYDLSPSPQKKEAWKNIHFVEQTDVAVTEKPSTNSRGGIERKSPLKEYFIAIVYPEFNHSLVALGYTLNYYDYFVACSLWNPIQSRGDCNKKFPISHIRRSLTGDFVTSPLSFYYQITQFVHVYSKQYRLLQHFQTGDRCRVAATDKLTQSTTPDSIHLDHTVYVKKCDLPQERTNVIAVDFANETDVNNITKSFPDFFPTATTNLFDARFVMISAVAIEFKLNNEKYENLKIVGEVTGPMMSLASDAFTYCSSRKSASLMSKRKETIIYRLPQVDESSPVQVYLIEVKEGDDVESLFSIDFTRLLGRQPTRREILWIPEVDATSRARPSLNQIIRPESFNGQWLLKAYYDSDMLKELDKFHIFQRTSVQLTASHKQLGRPEDPSATGRKIRNFVYAIFHKESEVLVAAGLHQVPQQAILKSFAIDFYKKLDFEDGPDVATSPVGFYFNNFLLKFVGDTPYNHALQTLLHHKGFDAFGGMKEKRARILNLKSISVRNKLFVDSTDASWVAKDFPNEYKDDLELIYRLPEEAEAIGTMADSSGSEIMEQGLEVSDKLAMVSDVRVNITLKIQEDSVPGMFDDRAGVQVIAETMLLDTQQYASNSMPGCFSGATFYRLPLDDAQEMEVDVYAIMMPLVEGLPPRDFKCLVGFDFTQLKGGNATRVLVPLMEYHGKFHKNLGEIVEGPRDFAKVHFMQRVNMTWSRNDGNHGTDREASAVPPGLPNLLKEFLWAVVNNNQLLVSGYYRS